MAKKGHRIIALAYKEITDVSEIPNMKGSKQNPSQSTKAPGQKKEKSGGVLNVEKNGFILHMLIGIQDLARP